MRQISATISGASPSVASSRTITSGFSISARPIASICCSPPDSAPPPWPMRWASRGNVASTRSSVHARQRGRGPRAGSPTAPRPRGHHEVLAHRQVRERCRGPRARSRCRVARCGPAARAVRRDRRCGSAGARAMQAEHRADQRRLAHPVAAEQADRLAAADRERDAVQDVALPVMRMDVARVDQRFGRRRCRGTALIRSRPPRRVRRGTRPARRDRARTAAGASLAITRPSTITVMRSATRKTASMSCSISRTAWPSFSSSSSASIRSVSSAPIPASGSSSSSTCGFGREAHRDLELSLLAVRQRAGRLAAATSRAPRARARAAPRRGCRRSATPGVHQSHGARLARLRGQPAVLEDREAPERSCCAGSCGRARRARAAAASSASRRGRAA